MAHPGEGHEVDRGGDAGGNGRGELGDGQVHRGPPDGQVVLVGVARELGVLLELDDARVTRAIHDPRVRHVAPSSVGAEPRAEVMAAQAPGAVGGDVQFSPVDAREQ